MSHDEWVEGDRFFTGFVVTSFITSLLLWLTWVIFPIKRKQSNTLMFNTCTVVLSFTMLMIIMKTNGKPSQISCKNESEYMTQDDGGMCLFQAMVFFYFTLAGVAFWCVSSIDLYMKIVLNKKIDMIKQKRLNRLYMICGWSIPFLLLIIGLSVKAFGGAQGTPYCFFYPTNDAAVDWALFFYPIIIFVFGGSFCMGSIIYKMVMSARATGTTRRAGWWKSQIRPFLFIFVFIFIFAFIFGYRAHMYFQQTKYKDSATEWVACLLSTLGDLSVCGVKPAVSPNVGLWYMLQLAIAGQGLLNSIIFGSQWMNVLLWYGLLTGRGTDYRGDKTGTTEGSKSERQGSVRTHTKNSTKQGRHQRTLLMYNLY